MSNIPYDTAVNIFMYNLQEYNTSDTKGRNSMIYRISHVYFLAGTSCGGIGPSPLSLSKTLGFKVFPFWHHRFQCISKKMKEISFQIRYIEFFMKNFMNFLRLMPYTSDYQTSRTIPSCVCFLWSDLLNLLLTKFYF